MVPERVKRHRLLNPKTGHNWGADLGLKSGHRAERESYRKHFGRKRDFYRKHFGRLHSQRK